MAQGRSRRFITSSAVFFLGSTLAHLIQFFLLPLYTRVIDPAAYGNYDLWSNLLIYLAPVAFFQVWDAVYRLWFDGSDREAVVTNGYLMMLLGVLVYSVVLVPVLVGTGAAPAWLIYLFGLSWCLQYFFGYLARGELRNGLFVGTGMINSLVNAALGVGLVLGAGWGISGVYMAVVAGNVVQAAIIETRLRSHRMVHRRHLSRAVVRDMMRFAMPLCMASVAGWALSGFTRIAINTVLDDNANGLYAVADKFTYVITMVMAVFQFAWNELLYLSFGDSDRKELYREGSTAVLNFAVIGAAGTVLLARLAWDFLVGPAFADAWVLVPLVVAAGSINAAAGFLASLFMAEKRTASIFWTTVAASVTNLVLAVPLLHWLGLAGAPIALAIACTVMLVSRIVLSSRMFGIVLLQPGLVVSLLVFAAVSALYWTEPSALVSLLALLGVAGYFLFATRRIWTVLLTNLRSRGAAGGARTPEPHPTPPNEEA